MYCPKCGNPNIDTASFCEYCGQELERQAAAAPAAPVQPAAEPVPAPAEKKENMITGLVGALFGAALGAASIILFSQLGYVAALSGLILAVCTFKGYELLGGKLGTKGVILCLLLIAATPYFADRLDWAIVIVKNFPDISLGEAYRMIPLLLKEDAIDMAEYVWNLVKIYGFVALGAFGSLRGK